MKNLKKRYFLAQKFKLTILNVYENLFFGHIWHFLTVWNWGFFDLLSFLQICHFHIGSYAFDENLMKFSHQVLKYNDSRKNTILDYQVEIYPLKPEDRTYIWLNIGNYSLTGFEMKLARHSVSKSIFLLKNSSWWNSS